MTLTCARLSKISAENSISASVPLGLSEQAAASSVMTRNVSAGFKGLMKLPAFSNRLCGSY